MKIFRRFRLYFLENKNLRKYTFYAVGEVLLIVVGILIALRLNNLNEESISRQKEKLYLQEYLTDLKSCNQDLDRTINRTEDRHKYSDSLLYAILNFDAETDLQDINRLLNGTYGWTTFITGDGTVTEILNGGNLPLITNAEIRSSIATWYSDLKRLQIWEVVLREFVQEYYSVLIDYVEPVSQQYDQLSITTAAAERLFSQNKFKNIVNNLKWRNKHLNEMYRQKDKEIDSLIAIINSELKQFD